MLASTWRQNTSVDVLFFLITSSRYYLRKFNILLASNYRGILLPGATKHDTCAGLRIQPLDAYVKFKSGKKL